MTMWLFELIAITVILVGIAYEDTLIEVEDLIFWCLMHPKKCITNTYKHIMEVSKNV